MLLLLLIITMLMMMLLIEYMHDIVCQCTTDGQIQSHSKNLKSLILSSQSKKIQIPIQKMTKRAAAKI